MKKLALLGIFFIAILNGCTPMKRAQTGIVRGIAGQETIKVDGNEVYCSQGKVCSEIDVLAISMEQRDGGKVRVTFKNRTDNTALFQVRLEVRGPGAPGGPGGEILRETRPENVVIPATQEKTYEMPGIAVKGGTVRVIMN